MGKLYLVQHGKQTPEEVNPEEPLSQEGKEDCEKVARFAKNAGVKVDEIFHSVKLRAKETAEILAEYLLANTEVQEKEGLKAMDDVGVWAEKMKNYEGDLMLVGHLPFMQKLSSLMIAGNTENPVYKFQQGGIVCLEKGEEEKWILCFAVNPELL